MGPSRSLAIVELIKTGAEQADLVPEQFGGSYKG